MKRILATTALTATLCMPAFAQQQAPEEPMVPEAGAETQAEAGFITAPDPQDIMASELIGKRVYALEEAYSGDGIDTADPSWEDIGEVNDVLLDRSASVEGILVDVGGFLGIGEKTVALSMDSLTLVADNSMQGEYFVTVASSREELDQAPAFEVTDPATEGMEQASDDSTGAATPLEEAPGDDMAAGDSTDVTDDTLAADPNSGEEMDDMAQSGDATTPEAAPGTAPEAGLPSETAESDATAPESGTGEASLVAEDAPATEPMEGFSREGYSEVTVTELTSDDLVGTPVYDSEDSRVGEISDLLVASDGTVTDAVIDVGGFLGIGEKPVAISFQGISLQQQIEGTELRAYVNTTEEQLKEFPEYEGG